MRKVVSLFMIVGFLGLTPAVSQGAGGYEMPDQTFLDAPSDQFGSWPLLQGGLDARPYVSKLSVWNAGVETKVIENGTPTSPTPPAGTIALAISPFNLCRTGQIPAPGVCYASPNRIGVTVGYQIDRGQMGYDFASPRVTLLTRVDADSEFDITLALNTLGKTLRWTWANGTPTAWGITGIGTDAATLRIRLKPVLTPVASNGGGCPQVPVVACEFTTAAASYLGANLVLSLDTTLDTVFTGALFSTTRSYMGSMSAVTSQSGESSSNPGGGSDGGSGGGSGDGSGGGSGGGTGANSVRTQAVTAGEGQLSYGVSAPITWSDGTPNKASFSAVISDATLLNFFGATSDVAASTEFQTSALNLSRTDSGTQGVPIWTRWSAGTEGTDGWLITIPDLTFSSGVTGSSVRAAAPVVQPAKVLAKTKVKSPKASVVVSGKVATVGMAGTVAACKKSSCRVVVSVINSKYGAKATKVGSQTLPKSANVSASLRVTGGKIKKATRLSLAVQAKKGAKWIFVTSAVVTVK